MQSQEFFQKLTGFFVDDFTELAHAPDAGGAHKAVWLQDCHAIVDIPHDDELAIHCGHVGTGAAPVHVQKRDF